MPYVNHHPFFCGGTHTDQAGMTDLCYGYRPKSDSWQKLGKLPAPRAHQAVSTHPTLGLFVSGGQLLNRVRSNAVWSTADGSGVRLDHPDVRKTKPICSRDQSDDTVRAVAGGSPSGLSGDR